MEGLRCETCIFVHFVFSMGYWYLEKSGNFSPRYSGNHSFHVKLPMNHITKYSNTFKKNF